MSSKKQMTSNKHHPLKTFVVRIARDLSEYADVAVVADDASHAEEIVADLLNESKLNIVKYEPGDDRESPYTCDSWEMDEGGQVIAIIKNGIITFPPAPSRLTCPYCHYDGDRPTEHGGGFRYLADISTWREITGINKIKGEPSPILTILSLAGDYDEDEEKNERIECRACLMEFPIPPGVETRFR